MAKVSYELAGDATSIRHTVGGFEIAIDTGDTYKTDDPEQIRQLDTLADVKRVKEAKQ